MVFNRTSIGKNLKKAVKNFFNRKGNDQKSSKNVKKPKGEGVRMIVEPIPEQDHVAWDTGVH